MLQQETASAGSSKGFSLKLQDIRVEMVMVSFSFEGTILSPFLD